MSGRLNFIGETRLWFPSFIIVDLELGWFLELKHIVKSISGLYLSSIKSMLFRFIKLNFTPGFILLYLFIILGTIPSAKEGVVPILIKSADLDLYVFAIALKLFS